MTEKAKRKVVSFRPKTAELEAEIRLLAENDERVFFGPHARERMEERGISRLEALRVLRKGHADGPIEVGKKPGEYKVKMVARLKGSREIGVVTILIERRRLFVKTVEWEDL
ncbi:DUF4258 domain-containing protein [Novosphingobium album (ex Hu et al. 2023)]|uniref:DUF4258 domain-containing protein n=1 Tax=Novosphingobium album (ex Hu et al. 2023) TaxID=2930093 RepID=A0ABT0B6X3_9SPHN|nr:DUF4258 domain-containing protein [Novosphingobium album (ex Hu et al. 2023)]MCJ2180805.1 DUF4258 domain-containing protein [Novosphingobium album (ex Hu et al. 2023)]